MIKSIWSVVAGIITIVFLSIATDAFLEAIKFFPPQNQGMYSTHLLVIALFYRTVYAFVGGFLTAKLSPKKPMKHVIILLSIGTVLGTLGVISGWNLSAHWYPILLVITSALAVWFGGKLAIKNK